MVGPCRLTSTIRSTAAGSPNASSVSAAPTSAAATPPPSAALGRIREGGCILAEEVGLGKTVEAGLIIVQLQAEGARRVLIVVPKPLQGQWQQELYTLFGVEVRDGSLPEGDALDGGGVFLVGREWAGWGKPTRMKKRAKPWARCSR